ncbi:MAG: glycosyltransferase, partial [Ferruginibacter sp.]
VQSRKIFQTIRKENAWLREQVKQYNIDVIISDNRYGLYHAEATSIFITHQLNIETGNSILNKIAQKINYYFINRFSACWVPDGNEEIKLAGKLSHPEIYPSIPVRYIDILSRFSPLNVDKEYDIIILLSGPEPQRSILEEKLISQAINTEFKILLVRGLPGGNTTTLKNTARLEIVNHLPARVLNTKMAASALVVCRSGYSSVMDLIAMQKKAVFIPTPGQKEQEYLAAWLKENKWFNYKQQEEFMLQYVFSLAENYSPPLNKKTNVLDNSVDNLLAGFRIPG